MKQSLIEKNKIFSDTSIMATTNKFQVSDEPRIKQNKNISGNELARYVTYIDAQKKQIVYTSPRLKKLQTYSSNLFQIDESNLVTNTKIKFAKIWQEIKKLYICDDIKVFNYLYEKPKVANFLLSAAPKIAEVFVNEKLKLKILYDPEIVGWKKLIIAIHTSLDGYEAFEKLQLLGNNWWLDASELVWDELGINIDFDEI